MYAALAVIILLIDATPAILIAAEPMVLAIATAVTMSLAIIIGCSLRSDESRQLASILPMVAIAILPAIWIVIQILPWGNSQWAHPVWQSAATALGSPVLGSLSIDPGRSLLALCNYLLVLGIVLVVAAVAIDRDRAKWILLTLTVATTLIAALLMLQEWQVVKLLGDANARAANNAASDSVALGAVLCATATARAVDPYERARSGSLAPPVPAVVASLAAFALCVVALVASGTNQQLCALGLGLGTLLAGAVLRYFRLGSWGVAGAAAAMILAAASIIAAQPRVYTLDPTLAFATAAPESLSVAQRMLADGGWAGSGAGTFSVLVPLYRDLGDSGSDVVPPTAAAGLAIELGYAAAWAAFLLAVVAVLFLLRGASIRGRDWFYPAGGAGCIVAATLLAFTSAGMLNVATMIIFATTVGLAFAQTKSRTYGFVDQPPVTRTDSLRHGRRHSDISGW